jgi:ABC-type dipeptide/oligopeptide/nickel transport system permease subunit
VVQLIVLAVGVPLGLLSGYLGGWVDTVIMRITDVFYGFPSLLLALLMLSAFGGQIFWVFLAIAIGTWPSMARLVRGQVLSLREKEYVEAAKALGVKQSRIMFKHIFPNTLGPLIVAVSFGVPEAILTEAFLGYIGVSVPPPATSWGQLVNDGFQGFRSNTPTILLIPALAIAFTVMSLNFIGDGLRDALDPKTKNR